MGTAVASDTAHMRQGPAESGKFSFLLSQHHSIRGLQNSSGRTDINSLGYCLWECPVPEPSSRQQDHNFTRGNKQSNTRGSWSCVPPSCIADSHHPTGALTIIVRHQKVSFSQRLGYVWVSICIQFYKSMYTVNIIFKYRFPWPHTISITSNSSSWWTFWRLTHCSPLCIFISWSGNTFHVVLLEVMLLGSNILIFIPKCFS